MNNTFPTEGNLSGLSRKDFQKEINNKETDLFILKNKKGMEVAVTNYGCAILAIMVPDKDGKYANVVLGHDSIDHVVNSPNPSSALLSDAMATASPKENSHCTEKSTSSPSTTDPTPCTEDLPVFTPAFGMPTNWLKI